MNVKARLLALVFCLFLVILIPGLVQAQGGLAILDSSAEADFPSKLNFSLSAQSNVNITDIRLCYTVDRMSFAQVTSEVYIEFTPSTTVDVSWTLEMVKIGGLPPGSSVEYWWRVEDAGGNKVETAPVQVRFDDTRYSWRSLTEEKVTVYWYKGDDSFAREIMSAAQQALGRLAEDTGASPEKLVKIYVYANQQDFIGALIYPSEWVGGVNFPTYNIIAIPIAPGELGGAKRLVAHELTHQVTYQVTANPYSSLPVWLNEGLATYEEGLLDPGLASYLSKAINEDKLISVRSLSSEFSAIPEQAYLSYAESYSLVEFLISSYGQSKMLELLNTFRQGSCYDDALERVYGFDMGGLDSLWRDYVTKQYRSAAAEWMHPALVAAGF
jgi:hypothetical protein